MNGKIPFYGYFISLFCYLKCTNVCFEPCIVVILSVKLNVYFLDVKKEFRTVLRHLKQAVTVFKCKVRQKIGQLILRKSID